MGWSRDILFVGLSLVRIRFSILKLYLVKGRLSHMMRILHGLSLLPFGRRLERKNAGGKTPAAEKMLIGVGVKKEV
jgi:hypothetical protein